MRVEIRKGQLPILIFNLLVLTVFSFHFISKKNHEFILYIGVIIFFLGVFILTNSRVYFPNVLFWGLSIWALMHLAGGAIYINGDKLYELILIPLSENHPVFRYDQLVHIIGFAIATIVMFYVLKPLLRENLNGWIALSIVVVAAGLGVGAFNEIVEFMATVLVPETGVGGYLNTSLDLVADFIGALVAIIIIRITNKDICPRQIAV
jgi:putative membrane protein